jgi:Skp family chaperone for outer membrane proteins
MQTVRTRKGLELVRSALFDELDPETIQINFRPVVPPLEEEELQAALEEELQAAAEEELQAALEEELQAAEEELHPQARVRSLEDQSCRHRQPGPEQVGFEREEEPKHLTVQEIR